MKTKFFSILVIGLLSQMGFAQDFDKAMLDNYLKTLERNEKFMGSFAVSQNGEIIYSKSIGFSDFDNISYAMTSNGTNYSTNSISIVVLSAVFNKPYDIPEFKAYAVQSEDLDKYLGLYSSTQIPVKITITKESNIMIAQVSGQPSFPLEATEKDKFKFDQAGVVLEFNPSENSMIFK